MLHGIFKDCPVHDVDIDVVGFIAAVAIEHSRQVLYTDIIRLAQCRRDHREGIGNTIAAVFIIDMRNRLHSSQCPRTVTAMHRVCARCQRLTDLAAIRRRTSLLAVHDIRRDRED